MKEVVQWISDVARISWDIFCMAPVTCILLMVVFVVIVFLTRSFIKDVVCTNNGGPIILR